MKKLLFALMLLAGSVHAEESRPYFTTIFKDPTHPRVSATMLYTSKMDFDGGVTDVALVYHKASAEDSLWPQRLLDAGFPPIAWTLLEVGGGGNRETAFVHAGVSLNVAPTLLGPVVSALRSAGGKAAAFGNILVSPDGSGLKVGLGWKSNVVQNGGILKFDQLRFAPRYGVGYTYQF